MTDAIPCPSCGSSIRPADKLCPRCGQALAANAIGPDAFRWTDGNGQAWQVEASPEVLTLIGQDARFDIARDEWPTSLMMAPMGGSVVLRVDTGDREVGFMLPRAEFSRFLAALAWDEQVADDRPAPVAYPAPKARSVRNAGRGPIWPKMTAIPVIALLLSVVAFAPTVGIIPGLAAYVFAVLAWRRSRNNLAYKHVRIMAKLSIAIATVGIATCLLSAYATRTATPVAGQTESMSNVELKWSIGAGIAAFVMILISLSFHEAAHAITAWWCGDDYAKSLGRVTLNPLAHIDPFGTVLLPLLLMYAGLPVFGYARSVPVRLQGLRKFRRAHILVSAAGPVSNLLQACICLALLVLIAAVLRLTPGATVNHFADFEPIVEISGVAGGRVLGGLALMLKLGFGINVLLAFFNLIPLPPLDGSWILEHLFPNTLGRVYEAIRPMGFLLFLALIWFGGNTLMYLLMPAWMTFGVARGVLRFVLGF